MSNRFGCSVQDSECSLTKYEIILPILLISIYPIFLIVFILIILVHDIIVSNLPPERAPSSCIEFLRSRTFEIFDFYFAVDKERRFNGVAS